MESKIELNRSDLEKWLSFLSPQRQATVLVNVTNRLARSARKAVRDEAVKMYNVRKSSLLIKVLRAGRGRYVAKLTARRRPFSLMRFKPVQTASGVTAQVKRGQMTTIDDAFMARPSGQNWRSRGQKKQGVVSSIPIVFKRQGKMPYKIQSPRSEFSIGQFMVGSYMDSKIKSMIAREAPGMVEQGVRRALRRDAIMDSFGDLMGGDSDD